MIALSKMAHSTSKVKYPRLFVFSERFQFSEYLTFQKYVNFNVVHCGW